MMRMEISFWRDSRGVRTGAGRGAWLLGLGEGEQRWCRARLP